VLADEQPVLWRVRVDHLSAWDFNWKGGGGGGDGGGPPPPGPDDGGGPDGPDRECASIIECQNQVLGERIPLGETPYNLYYSSGRVPGRQADNEIRVALTGPGGPPPELAFVDVEVNVAGREFTQRYFPDSIPAEHLFQWDGKDFAGRDMQGSQLAIVTICYAYSASYAEVAVAGGATPATSFGDPEVRAAQAPQGPAVRWGTSTDTGAIGACRTWRTSLCVNMSETAAPPKISVEGGGGAG